MPPNFSAYPWERVARLSRRDARMQSIVARWIGARRSSATRLAQLVGTAPAEIVARVVDAPNTVAAFDPHAAACVVRIAGIDLGVLGSSGAVRAIAQRVLGGLGELPAPRPLTIVERSIWSLLVATALEDLGVPGHVWPVLEEETSPGGDVIALDVAVGDITLAVLVIAPPELPLRAPPADVHARRLPAWAGTFAVDATIVMGRCALRREALARLEPRQLVTLERPTTDADLDLLGGSFGLRGRAGALEATVVRGYGARDMALPDDAHVELTVAAGTTRMPLREVLDLAIGQIIPLGRPLAGPFEVRAEGRVLGRGELVDVDGELAVRIVSVGD